MALPKFYIILNAFFWGIVWIPLKYFNEQGVHPIYATFFCYLILVIIIVILKRSFFFLLFFREVGV
tara:strand:+ start:2506 stop:2703 length:198 start_codon:yes stop_codon:yes gene_type:complete